jgi:nucleotide-binding universal stress UspA family protein
MTLNNADPRPILIAYDGSDFAKAAVADAAGQLGPGRKAIVLTVWEPLEELPFLGIRGVASDAEAVETVIAETRAGAEQVAKEGAKLASEAGFEAHAETASGDPAWRQIVEVADERDAVSSCSAHAGALASATCSWGASPLRSPSTASAPC